LGDCDCVSELGRLGFDEPPEKSSEIICQAMKTAPSQIMALWSVFFILFFIGLYLLCNEYLEKDEMKVESDKGSRID
jgi:hypothetical protein